MRIPKKRQLRHKVLKWEKPKPGTVGHRFNRIMDMLEDRWPDPEPYSARAGEGRYFKMIDKERRSMRTALQAAITALDDWTNTYAPEFCDEQRVKEAQNRLQEYGTIAYIADVVTQCRKALKGDEDVEILGTESQR